MQHIRMEDWSRREAAAFFGALDFPFYNISWRADVTRLHAAAKGAGQSFYYSMIYEIMAALNGTDAFLYKLRGDNVVRHEALAPSFTVPCGEEGFKIVGVSWERGETRTEFCERARAIAEAQTRQFLAAEQGQRDD